MERVTPGLAAFVFAALLRHAVHALNGYFEEGSAAPPILETFYGHAFCVFR